jgi:hypothetical protein
LTSRRGVSIGHERLDILLSADGFSYLLEFFAERHVDAEEFSRFLMRLYVPGYEKAFRLIDAALADDVYEQRSNRSFLSQSEIESIIEAHREGRLDNYLE